jgi:hypothetical protein
MDLIFLFKHLFNFEILNTKINIIATFKNFHNFAKLSLSEEKIKP